MHMLMYSSIYITSVELILFKEHLQYDSKLDPRQSKMDDNSGDHSIVYCQYPGLLVKTRWKLIHFNIHFPLIWTIHQYRYNFMFRMVWKITQSMSRMSFLERKHDVYRGLESSIVCYCRLAISGSQYVLHTWNDRKHRLIWPRFSGEWELIYSCITTTF